MIHEMNLQKEPFLKIKSGAKKVESRLFDDKRKKINIGDIISFSVNTNGDIFQEKINTKVTALFLYSSFEKMMKDLPSSWFGWDSSASAIEEINKFYSSTDQENHGVIGIKIELID